MSIQPQIPNPQSPIPLYCDVAIIGGGGAGLRAAISAAQAGLNVLCISKVPPTRSHTVAAQGGINAALGNRGPDDWRWHMYDTVRAGDWLGDQDAIAALCEGAPDAIIELESMGMAFTRADDGRIYQRAYGGQRTDFGKGGPAYRACAVADRTGHALLHTLYAQARKHEVKFTEEWLALDLVFDAQGACRGVLALELATGDLHCVRAHRTIIATGGFGQAWANTTSSSICTGDGSGMALRAGLPLQDMEFVQFHPTGLYGAGILITEGARGEGAYLRNAQGERFMEKYAPKSLELASRDVIARAMAVEIQQGRGCGPKKDHLHLCLQHLDPEMVRGKLPAVLDIARTFAGINALKQPIPVVPSVHFTMGGIPTNAQCESDAPGLLAIGEAACASVHGANRLGCNSLLDLVVFGKIAGEQCARTVKPGAPHPALPDSSLQPALAHFHRLQNAGGNTTPAAIRKATQEVMQRCAGIFRTAPLLESGSAQLATLWDVFQTDLRVGDRSRIWNNDLIAAIEAESLLLQAMACMASALARQESRGAHWREDFPSRDDAHWLTHSLCGMDGGKLRLGTRPVRAYTGGTSYPPEPRSY